jgi:uncharacterized protein (DUF1501 family)
MDCCREHLLRRAVAQAGSGLPLIEPGMPLPAGTGLDRRAFVARSLGLALAVYGAGRLPAFDAGIAQAAGTADPVLVTVYLNGGVDSLSLLAPIGDPDYRRLRPRLALPDSGLRFGEDDRLRWHPAARSLETLHREGKLTVMPAVGYTDADQSHFTSRHFWEVGATDPGMRTGWLGRWLDRVGAPDNPLQGLSLDGELAPALATARAPVAAVRGADEYGFWSPNVWGDVEERMIEAIGALGAVPHADPALAQAAGVSAQAERLYRQLAPFRTDDGFSSPVEYPKHRSDFPERLAGLAAMLALGLPIRAAALTAYGMYDTHSDQADRLAAGLQLTSDSLLAFQRDLEARGLADRVVTLVWSEFGRRAEENGSRGTDHGAAGAGFLLGTRVRGRQLGEFPGLRRGLDDDGNLRATVDYRSVYASLLEEWLGTDAAAVLPRAGSFPRVRLLR